MKRSNLFCFTKRPTATRVSGPVEQGLEGLNQCFLFIGNELRLSVPFEALKCTHLLGEVCEQIVFGNDCQAAKIAYVSIEVPHGSLDFRGVDHRIPRSVRRARWEEK